MQGKISLQGEDKIYTRYSVSVFGMVQGVGFRYSSQRAAAGFRVSGWVRNNSDGSVEIECEGEKQGVEDFIRWLEHGPPYARVTRIEKQEKPYHGYYKGFSIEY